MKMPREDLFCAKGPPGPSPNTSGRGHGRAPLLPLVAGCFSWMLRGVVFMLGCGHKP